MTAASRALSCLVLSYVHRFLAHGVEDTSLRGLGQVRTDGRDPPEAPLRLSLCARLGLGDCLLCCGRVGSSQKVQLDQPRSGVPAGHQGRDGRARWQLPWPPHTHVDRVLQFCFSVLICKKLATCLQQTEPWRDLSVVADRRDLGLVLMVATFLGCGFLAPPGPALLA